MSIRDFARGARSSLSTLLLGSAEADVAAAKLERACVPVTTDACRDCSNPCENPDGSYVHEDWPSRMSIDMDSDMLGKVKAYYRMVVISTGKSDWERDVTDARGSLANALSSYHSKQHVAPRSPKLSPALGPGIINPEGENRLLILNGSHRTTSEDCTRDTALVFPDYKMVAEVGCADTLWKNSLDPLKKRGGSGIKGVKSWTLPYHAVLLLCSHRRRDSRCGVAAPILKRALTESLESEGWEVHDQLDDPDHFDECPIEDIPGGDMEREIEVNKRLKGLYDESRYHSKRALILFCSHTGGHKYAGNVIIHTPSGAGIWYGRVSSHEVGAVTKTITEGRIYPGLLRAGMNIARKEGKTVLDW